MSLRPRFRAWAVGLAIAGMAACGGDPTTSPPPAPPPPPPPPGGPASLVVEAGAGQIADPGAPVPVSPVVRVRNAGGTGVPGVVVSFAIETGGGTVAAASATTGADGRASPGEWRLGPTEGPNTLRASVAGLPPVTISATAQVVVVSVPPINIGSGGGTAAVNQPGSPIHGMTITVPAGSYPAGQTFSISHFSSAGFPLPQGMTAAGPQIQIQTSLAMLAEKGLRVTVPVIVPAGHIAVLLGRDPVSGTMIVLPTVGQTATTITAATAHFNGALLGAGAPAGTGGVQQVAPTTGSSGTVMVLMPAAIPTALLDQERDSGFRPGVDSWDIPAKLSTVLTEFIFPGLVGTQNWFYTHQKSHGPLYKKYRELEDVYFSNRRGLRWVSIATRDVFNTAVTRGVQASALDNAPQREAEVSVAAFRTIQATMLAQANSGQPLEPQFAMIYTGGVVPAIDGIDDVVDDDTPFRMIGLTVYAAGPGWLRASHPDSPDQTLTLTFSGTAMNPVSLPTLSPLPFSGLVTLVPSLYTDLSPLSSQWAAVQAGTIGDGDFPTYEFRIGWGNTAAETAPLTNANFFIHEPPYKVRFWADCITCTGMPRPSALPTPGPNVALMTAYKREGNKWVENYPDGQENWIFGATISSPEVGTGMLPLALFGTEEDPHAVPDADQQIPGDWMDWVITTPKRLAAAIAPADSEAEPDTDITFTAEVPGLPGNVEYVWSLVGPVQTITPGPQWTHRWSTPGTYDVSLEVRDKTTKQPIALAFTQVTIQTPPLAAWKISSASVQHVDFSKDVSHVSWQVQLLTYTSERDRWLQVQNGATEGAIVYNPTDAVVSGIVRRQGLYLLMAPQITPDLLVLSGNLIALVTTTSGTNQNPPESYTEGGTLPGNASISGVRWCGSTGGGAYPVCVRTSSIVVNGNVMTGSLEYTFWLRGGAGNSVIYDTASMDVSFTAVRMP